MRAVVVGVLLGDLLENGFVNFLAQESARVEKRAIQESIGIRREEV